jgi:vacuolar protein sorting-associated protein 13A/C
VPVSVRISPFILLCPQNFLNNFQVAKEALSVATAQAAEKAATSVKDLAQRSFRVSVNIDLKAPVIVIPQSSISTNAVVVDLGLIRVQNQFSVVSDEDSVNPPVIDRMDVQLTKLKLSRYACSVIVGLSINFFHEIYGH